MSQSKLAGSKVTRNDDSEVIVITSEYKGTRITSVFVLSDINDDEHYPVIFRHAQLHQRSVEALESGSLPEQCSTGYKYH